jgi:hypothetical protein
MSLTAAALASALVFGSPATTAQDPLTYEQYVSCSAMFFLLADVEQDPELRSAFEASVAVMITRATPLGARRGLNQDAVITAAATESEALERRVSSMSRDQRINTYRTYGPGIEACLTEVLTER